MATVIRQIRQLLSILCSVVKNVIDVATPEIPQGAERWSDLDRLNRERDLVGIYLSAHPLDEFSIVLEHVCNTRMADLEDKAALVGREITMGGIVTNVRRGVSKNGNPYGIAKIEDYSGSTEIPFWGNDWVTYQGYLNEGTFLYIKARCQAKQWRQDELEVKITSMELLPDRERRTGTEDHDYHSSVSLELGFGY